MLKISNKGLIIRNARIVDSQDMSIKKGDIEISGTKIRAIGDIPERGVKEIDAKGSYAIPGLMDAHVHIESSLLEPTHFGSIVSAHGTTSVIADCHEICNVIGIEGLRLFIKKTEDMLLGTFFAVPSCVPASPLGTSGAVMGPKEVREGLMMDQVVALGEVMDYPGVIERRKDIMEKIQDAAGKTINGHAPGLRGQMMRDYFDAGIMDDHESFSYEEMAEKADYGAMIFLREGSAESTDDKCYSMIESHPDNVCFCSDDKSASDIAKGGSILYNLNKAIRLGHDPLTSIRCATYNCAGHYGLADELGNIRPGLRADFFLSRSLGRIRPQAVVCRGELVFSGGKRLGRLDKPDYPQNALETIRHRPISEDDISKKQNSGNIIIAKDGSLETGWEKDPDAPEIEPDSDILKIVVIERYHENGNISVGKIKGFGIRDGAIGSTVSHDCHNIVVVGSSNEQIVKVANHLINENGGLAVFGQKTGMICLPLPLAGLMSLEPSGKVIAKTMELERAAKKIGCRMRSPFATLSFMALEVIPKLKITDKGLVDVEKFRII